MESVSTRFIQVQAFNSQTKILFLYSKCTSCILFQLTLPISLAVLAGQPRGQEERGPPGDRLLRRRVARLAEPLKTLGRRHPHEQALALQLHARGLADGQQQSGELAPQDQVRRRARAPAAAGIRVYPECLLLHRLAGGSLTAAAAARPAAHAVAVRRRDDGRGGRGPRRRRRRPARPAATAQVTGADLRPRLSRDTQAAGDTRQREEEGADTGDIRVASGDRRRWGVVVIGGGCRTYFDHVGVCVKILPLLHEEYIYETRGGWRICVMCVSYIGS